MTLVHTVFPQSPRSVKHFGFEILVLPRRSTSTFKLGAVLKDFISVPCLVP